MCRVLSYLGKPILLENLLYKPDNSLITQSHNPKLMSDILNLAGFGFVSWDRKSVKPDKPLLYRVHTLPFYDENLYHLSSTTYADCMIAHVRGIDYSEKNVVSNENVHPFLFPDTNVAFAHNGSLIGFTDMKFEILGYVKNEYRMQIHGITDTETMYALFLSQLPDPENVCISDVFSALIDTFSILNQVRKKNNMLYSSPLNFFVSNGKFIVATRFVFDYGHYPSIEYSSPHMGYHSLWYTFGEEYCYDDGMYQMKASRKRKSIIISSEPLTEDSTTWVEVPEYSFIAAELDKGDLVIKSLDVIV